MRKLEFEKQGWEDFGYWLKNNGKFAQKIHELAEESLRNPFDGKGKPEPLKGNLTSYWSRRIGEEHRMISKVTEETIIIASCKGHY